MEPQGKIHYHKNLAEYFCTKPQYLDEPNQKKPNTRKLVEQFWQQTKGEMWDEVTEILCNLDFIQVRVEVIKINYTEHEKLSYQYPTTFVKSTTD